MSGKWLPSAVMVTIGALSTGTAHTQVQVLGPNPVIANVPLACFGANTVVMPLDDIAKAAPGVIYVDWSFFQLPGVVQLFIYAHECAHQIAAIGSNEQAADCWAVRLGRHQQWLTPGGLAAVETYFVNSPGDWTHSPGPLRVQQMEQCYGTP